MKYLVMVIALTLASTAHATGPIKYPADATPTAIAADQAVKASIAGKPGLEYCLLIDVRDPRARCVQLINLDAGGPASQ